MTRLFDAEAIRDHATPGIALAAMTSAFAAKATGLAKLPHRIDTPSRSGFIRVMPAVLDDVGATGMGIVIFN